MTDIFDGLYDELDDGSSESRGQVYTVSELTEKIRILLEDSVGFVRIDGELSNYRVSPAGHCYFVLKDARASIQCVMFKRSHSLLQFEPTDGMQVEVIGNVSVYEPRGQYQVVVEFMKKSGVGALFKAFNELKKRLEEEGLFDNERKKEIPFLPQRIGVVTSPTGAAIRDILNVVARRFANVEVIIYPALVQGDRAGGEIARAIRRMNELRLVDVLIVGRGGGSIEDLWAFNEEVVARAIGDSEIPVISAVGHETDFTISDFVSDLRAPTPSAAAELVTRNQEELLKRVKSLDESLGVAFYNCLTRKRLRLEKASGSYALRSPLEKFRRYQQRMDELVERLSSLFVRNVKEKKHGLERLCAKLEALSPLSILERGYSVVFKSGTMEIIKSPRQVTEGSDILIRSAGGDYSATVDGNPTQNNQKR